MTAFLNFARSLISASGRHSSDMGRLANVRLRQKRAFHNHFKTILGATSHHSLIALRIRYGSIIHSSCSCLSDAPRWPADQSMLYKETAARRDQTISRLKDLPNSREAQHAEID